MDKQTNRATLTTGLRVSDDLDALLSTEGQMAFVDYFVEARDRVEDRYYAEVDGDTTAHQRAMTLLGGFVKPLLGMQIANPQQFYSFLGRLTRWAWLSTSLGIYNDEINAIADPARRLLTAHVNTVDIAWDAAIRQQIKAETGGLLVEVGTGRGNSIIRLAYLLPQTKVVSITITPEQADISTALAKDLGADNVEVRLGDIFDPDITKDLVGKADAVTAIEVNGHFTHERKTEGMCIMGQMLKTGAPLSLVDLSVPKPTTGFRMHYAESNTWYHPTTQQYLAAIEAAGVRLEKYVKYTPSMIQSFLDTQLSMRSHRARLRQEFGAVVAAIWPEVMGTAYLWSSRIADYGHFQGRKQ